VIAILKKYFTYSKPSLIGISKFLSGDLHILTYLMPTEENRNYSLKISSSLGSVIYDHKLARNGIVLIESVEFVPNNKKVCFSFTVVNKEFSVLRQNGRPPDFSEKTLAENDELQKFMEMLRKIVLNHFKTLNVNV